MTKPLQRNAKKDFGTLIHDQLLLLQRVVRREVNLTPTVLGSQESIALMLLSTMKDPVAKEIVSRLQIQQSGASRLLSYLKKRGFITYTNHPSDRRSQIIRFTASGTRLLDQLRFDSTKIADRTYWAITHSEIVRLGRLWNKVMDGFGVPHDPGLPDEHAIEPASRRFVIGLGLIGPEYMEDSGFDLAEYQLLFELSLRNVPAKLSHLCRILPFDQSKLSRSVSKFVRAGFVDSVADRSDSRAMIVSLSEKGRKQFAATHARLSARFSAACKAWSDQDRSTLLNLHSKVIASPAASVRDRLHVCRSEDDRFLARRYLTERLVSRGKHIRLPEILIGSEDTTLIVLREDGSPTAVFSTGGKRGDVLWWCVCDPDLDPLAGSGVINVLLSQRRLSEIALHPGGAHDLDWLPGGLVVDVQSQELVRTH